MKVFEQNIFFSIVDIFLKKSPYISTKLKTVIGSEAIKSIKDKSIINKQRKLKTKNFISVTK